MVRKRDALIAIGAFATIAVCLAAGGCGGTASSSFDLGTSNPGDDAGASGGGSGSQGSTGPGSSGGSFAPGVDAGADAKGCTGLQCSVPMGCTTSLSGTVYDPAGANPLYNVVVFVPNDPSGSLPPIKLGTNTCSSCDVSIGDYVAATTSDANGHFTLTGVPATTKVPLVVQIGKWRREVFLPQVKACTDNPIAGSASTRLPKNHSEGNLPQMALVTGSADNLGCFLEGVGLDPDEYSAPHAGGRLDIYRGLDHEEAEDAAEAEAARPASRPARPETARPTTRTASGTRRRISRLTTSSCSLARATRTIPDDPDSNTPTNKTAGSKTALRDWLNEGGKAFATHYQYTWFKNSPAADFKKVATWLGSSGGDQTGNYDIDTTFPKGKIFNQWLANVKALTGTQIALTAGREQRIDRQRADAAVDLRSLVVERQVSVVRHAAQRNSHAGHRRGRREHRTVLRQGGLQRSARGRESGRRHPGQLFGSAADAPAEGARVSLLRSVGVRLERRPAPAAPAATSEIGRDAPPFSKTESRTCGH